MGRITIFYFLIISNLNAATLKCSQNGTQLYYINGVGVELNEFNGKDENGVDTGNSISNRIYKLIDPEALQDRL